MPSLRRAKLAGEGTANRIDPDGHGGEGRVSVHLVFGSAIGLAMLCTALLASALIWGSYADYSNTRRQLEDVGRFRVVLLAASAISSERGPSNALMSSDPDADADAAANAAAKLADARRATDRRLDEAAALASPTTSDALPLPPSAIADVRQQLATARAAIDAVVKLPKGQRSPAAIAATTSAMFDAFDRFRTVVSTVVRVVASRGTVSSVIANTGHSLCDLREYGGRLGSEIVPALAAGQPLTEHARLSASVIRGRVLQLWETGIASRLPLLDSDPRLAGAVDRARSRFMGDGLDLVDSLIEDGGRTGAYATSAAEFTRRYVETLRTLEVLRDTFLDLAIDDLRLARRNAGWMLGWTIGITMFTLLILTSLVVVLRLAVIAPLFGACREVVALAEEQSVARGRYTLFTGEMRRLFAALDVLHGRLHERASQARILALQAETDGLTGVLNRRALDVAGTCQDARTPETGCLILLDIDHFKSINDRFGHLAGDGVLKDIADLLRAHLDPSHVLARFGGEEFAILGYGLSLEAGARLARCLRKAIHERASAVPGGSTLIVTASFGVAEGRLGADRWISLVSRADGALYRAKAAGRNRVRLHRSGDLRLAGFDFETVRAPGHPRRAATSGGHTASV